MKSVRDHVADGLNVIIKQILKLTGHRHDTKRNIYNGLTMILLIIKDILSPISN